MHHGSLRRLRGYGDSGGGDRAGDVDSPQEPADDVGGMPPIGASAWSLVAT
jgi:hypothetical protein